jgi:hypothetical protein
MSLVLVVLFILELGMQQNKLEEEKVGMLV